MFLKALRVKLLSKGISILRSNIHSNTTREIKIAENNEVQIPMNKVVAKPCTGPEPNT